MQIVTSQFIQELGKQVVPVDWDFRVAFKKEFDPDIKYFILDSSLLDGGDLLGYSEDNPIQEWDKYTYEDYSDKVVSMEWERSNDFPYSVQSAMADISVDNTDGFFTHNPVDSEAIQSFILPKRPMRLWQGFARAMNLSQFVGLSQDMPKYTTTTAAFHALDFLSEMYNQPIQQTIAMYNVTTDVVIKSVLTQLGLLPSQYNIPVGRNTIPFLYFEKGVTAGHVLRSIMQAEMGLLWLDEQGLVRFTPRIVAGEAVSAVLDNSKILDIKTSSSQSMINHVKIISEIRAVQSFQSINIKDNEGGGNDSSWAVPVGGTLERFLQLDDPAVSSVLPILNGDRTSSWFTANFAGGAPVPSGVSVSGSLLVNTYKVTFTNSTGSLVYIDGLEIFGEPARVVNEIDKEYLYQPSIDKYGDFTIEINNNNIGSESNADSIAYFLLNGYQAYNGVIDIEILPNPAFQLSDVVDIDSGVYQGTYKITSIKNKLAKSGESLEYSQSISAVKYQIPSWFLLDISLLDGTDILAP